MTVETILAGIIGFAIAITALATGLLFGRAPLQGSCGGVAGGRCACGATNEDDCRLEEAP
jgi:hypothetical protein